MSAPMSTLPQSNPAIAVKKKKVLLVDTSRTKRDLRSETMRKLGAEVDCAADIAEARCWWRADLYDLVLIHANSAKELTDKFCDDMRRVMPCQKIMFLVGKPEYLAVAQNADAEPSLREQEVESALYSEVKIPLTNNGSDNVQQRWGILEACRRISQVRSALDARTRAIRERPVPTRDFESRIRDGGNGTDVLSELIREQMTGEMQ